MIMSELFVDKKKYKAMSMMHRILYDMVSYEANFIFADTIIHILAERNPNYHDDPNDLLRIREFQADRETSFTGKWYLQRLFESEYGELTDDAKENIKTTARELANIPLVKFGWIKEKETTTV